MKPIIVISCVLCFAIGFSEAQTKSNAKERRRQPEVPVDILNSVVRDFPQFAYDLEKMGTNQLKGEPKIRYKNQGLPQEVLSRYIVRQKGNDFKVTSHYNKAGKLLYTKEISKNIKLPKTTRDQLFASYNDWSMVRNREILSSRNKKPQHYTVILERGNERKKVLINNQGTILKAKNRFRI